MTSGDVARRAGVSRATVSYVLNDAPGHTISEATRRAVHRAAHELGYQPNELAQALRRGRTRTVLLPMNGYPMTEVLGRAIAACAAALAREGFTLVTDSTPYASPSDAGRAWASLRPVAIVDMLVRPDDVAVEMVCRAGTMLLHAGSQRAPAEPPIDDIAYSARQAQARHLLERGHRDLVLCIPAAGTSHLARFAQLTELVAAAGGSLALADVPFERSAMVAVAAEWARSGPPEAICALNDEYAAALLTAMHEVGLRAPRDVALIGLDDAPIAAAVSPALTTVAWELDGYGRSVAAATVAVAAGDAGYEVTFPAVRVVPRETA